MDPFELVKFCKILNPHNKPGKLIIITRIAAENMRVKFSHLIRAVRQAGLIVTWSEFRAFFDVHEQEGSHPGGVHLEMIGQHVTECIGGSKAVTFDDLNSWYYTHCDPRRNASQSLELTFTIAEMLRKKRTLSWNKRIVN